MQHAPTFARPSRAVRLRARSAGLLLAACALAAMPGCGWRRVQPEQCAQMLTRYLDMSIGADPALANLPPDQARAVREMKMALKRSEKSYAQVELRCEAEVTRKEYECTMHAGNADEWEACIQ